MAREPTIAPDDVRRASDEVRAHPERARVAALAYDVLGRQAEGRTLFAGREFVEGRASEHGIDRASAEVPTLEVLGLFERGPAAAAEHAMVGALAVSGLADKMADAGLDDRAQLAQRLARHAGWLEVASPVRVLPFVDALMDEEAAAVVWVAVGDLVLADRGETAGARARAAALLTSLGASKSAAARETLSRVARASQDEAIVALARALGAEDGEGGPGDDESPRGAPRVQGRLGHVPRGGALGALGLVTGLTALGWLVRGLLAAVGLRREASLALVPGGLELTRRVALLGRTVREGRETYTLAAIASAGRLVRYPSLHLLVGALCLAIGVVVGGVWIFEGAMSGETVLLLFGAGAILLGGGLDLGLSVLWPGAKGRVALELGVLPHRRLIVKDVPVEDADRFLDALVARLRRR